MTAIPAGFEPESKTRRVQFDFAPGTPPEVIAAAHAYARADEQGAEVPQGFEFEAEQPHPEPQQYGPGRGVSSPSDRASEIQRMEDMRRLEPNNPLENFGTGNGYGIRGTALGITQGMTHLLNVGRDPSLPRYGALALPDPQVVDEAVARFEEQRADDPAMETRSGRTGEFTGSLLATAPMGVAGVPAKGAPLMAWLTQGALSGGLAAATQPVDGGEDYWRNKAGQAGTGAAFGAGIPAAGRGILSLAERAYGPNIMAQIANAANKPANATAFAKEGEDLATRTGVRMTPGQVSGSKLQTGLENMSRQSFFSADKAFEADKRTAEDAIRYIDRVMDNVSKNPASEAAIGTQIQAATRGAVVKIAAEREKVALADYGALDLALGGRKFVQPDNAMREADAIIAEYANVATPEAERIVRQAQAMKKKLRLSGSLSFSQAQKSRSYYGRAARGAANVFDDVNPDINRRIASRIFRAFNDDIEQSSARLENGNLGPGLVPSGFFTKRFGPEAGNLAGAIRKANDNYRRYSQLIEATVRHPIARLFGDHIKIDDVVEFDRIAPEVVIDRLGRMKPTELQQVRGFMEVQAPEAWQQYKRLLINRALEEARTHPVSMGANAVPFNASSFVRALGGDKAEKIKQLQQIFGPSEMREIDDAFRVARRLGDNFGRNNSGTAQWAQAAGFWTDLKNLSIRGTMSTGGEVLGLRKVANVMLNAEGRRALIQLSKVPPGSRQAVSLLGVIAALASGQGSGQRHPRQSDTGY